MTKDEAMKLALEALEMYLLETNSQFQRSAVTALREALAEQPAQQEPVAWMHPDGRIWTFGRGLDKSTFTIPLYTSPPASKPLTDEEIEKLREKTFVSSFEREEAAVARVREFMRNH